jgi:Ca-activated chloride channel family protein
MRSFVAITASVCLVLFAYAQSIEENISIGNSYYKMSQFDLAEKHYRIVLKSDPANTTAQFNLANALYKQKKYDDATEILKALSENASGQYTRSSAFYNAGVINTRQKDLEASIQDYKNALRLNPDDRLARENLQKALRELKQKQQQKQQDQQQNQSSQSNISQKEAERKLEQLQEKEKKIQQRMQEQQGGSPQPKDW